MRAGQIAPFNPNDVRHDVVEENVERATRIPVGYPPGVAEYGPPPLAPMMAGSDAFGRSVMAFDLPHRLPPDGAQRYATQLRHLARTARNIGLNLTPAAAGSPLAALAAGHTVVLRWRNGVKVSVTA
jgi:hypothetical protein